MPRVTCRCGEKLKVPPSGAEHMDCPKCGARIRLRRPAPKKNDATIDGFIRFLCPCGRRLKVAAKDRPMAGKCPDCGRVVPVPLSGCGTLNSPKGKKPSGNNPESRTEDLDPAELAELEKWSARYLTKSGHAEGPLSTTGIIAVNSRAENDNNIGLPINAFVQASVVKFETGLRVCPRCKKPLHLSADNCRECGMPVPRQ
jgi:hypothetical protein